MIWSPNVNANNVPCGSITNMVVDCRLVAYIFWRTMDLMDLMGFHKGLMDLMGFNGI